ncbi:hypothetical protein PGJ36_002727 [Enterococcus hirae]|uniref:hypothetical protein n=1 Tax=Enterococcus TaxID=1350 RepID=UPI0009C0E8F1|nr:MULTISPECIES: hypothetical protein [Enterococcus]EMF0076364.1 hypothetical protein [Enterococcus hirae]EMF0131403.1 hypothetical protein [Enterococcus hirae]EMF0517404.1 hypothetical protein [Enterococcus hirae]OQO47171.1 hypothetical protein BH733_04700 [Enterococcus hirae]OTN87219.1 hypothetical protein A5809_002512 [Enterococcus faecium]
MKRFVGVALLLISLGIFGACGSQTNKLDEKAQKAEKEVLNYFNEMYKENREEENASIYEGDLTEKDVEKVYYSGEDFNEYIFVVEKQLYSDPQLKEKENKVTDYYMYKNSKPHLISDKEFEQLIKDKSNHFEKIYQE